MPKKENTFSFVSFNDRLKNIHVDVVRRRHRFSQFPGHDADSFFYEALEKWSDLDKTQDFGNFKRDIPSNADLQTYGQILHHQKSLSNVLCRHLAVEDSLCLHALLELTIALCRDLQKDFYDENHFWPVFDTIVGLITRQSKAAISPDLLEQIFSTLAHLLKFSWRPMSEHSPEVFDRFRQLINHRRSYLRRFSSEALSFLIRKTPDVKGFLLTCFQHRGENLAGLFVEAMRGANGQFHSRACDILTAMLEILENDEDAAKSAFDLLKTLIPDLSSYATDDVAKPLLVDVLVNRTRTALERLTEKGNEQRRWIKVFAKYLALLHVWRLNSKRNACDLCCSVVVRELLSPISDGNLIADCRDEEVYSTLLELSASIFGHRGVVDEYRKEFEKFTEQMFDPRYDASISLDARVGYVLALANRSTDGCGTALELICLPSFGKLVERTSLDADEHFDAILSCYCKILAIKRPNGFFADDAPYDLCPGGSLRHFRRALEERLKNPSTRSDPKFGSIVAVYGLLIDGESDHGGVILEKLLSECIDGSVGGLVFYSVLHSICRIDRSMKRIGTLGPDVWLGLFEKYRSPGLSQTEDRSALIWNLRAADEYFRKVGQSAKDGGTMEKRKRKIAEETDESRSVCAKRSQKAKED